MTGATSAGVRPPERSSGRQEEVATPPPLMPRVAAVTDARPLPDTMDVMDLAEGTWQLKPPIPERRDHSGDGGHQRSPRQHHPAKRAQIGGGDMSCLLTRRPAEARLGEIVDCGLRI